MLSIEYKSNKLKRVCTDFTMLVQFSIGRCHPLQGNRKGEYAIDLVHPYRLIFEQENDEIKFVRIIKIEDYH